MKKILFVAIALVVLSFSVNGKTRVLFIGDSITDAGWGRSGGRAIPSDKRNRSDQNHLLGQGYVYLCASYFTSEYPDSDFEFLNRGISGNTLPEMAARWQQDVIDLHPDVVSVLIGSNHSI